MKNLLLITLFSALCLQGPYCMGQASPGAKKTPVTNGSTQTYSFKLAGKQSVDLDNLSDGKHSFVSVDGHKLILTVQARKIVLSEVILSDGAHIQSVEKGVGARGCLVCFQIRGLNGATTLKCMTVPCRDIDKMNKSMSGI